MNPRLTLKPIGTTPKDLGIQHMSAQQQPFTVLYCPTCQVLHKRVQP